MYVDDEQALDDVGKRRLESIGYNVTGFTDPEDALEALVRDPFGFDIVVTDYSMPHRTGLELARNLTGVRHGLPPGNTAHRVHRGAARRADGAGRDRHGAAQAGDAERAGRGAALAAGRSRH